MRPFAQLIESSRLRGFTLAEVLVSVTLASMILIMAVQFMVSLSQDWAGRAEERLFDEHVDGVVRFFETTLSRNTLDNRLPSNDRYPELDYPPGYSELNDPMVRIRFPDGSPLFQRPGSPTGPVTAWFGHLEEVGVFALWKPDLAVEMEDYRDFYQTLITPWGSDIVFYYYDDEADLWEEVEEIRMNSSNQPTFPDRLKVTFTYEEDLEKIIIATLPRKSNDVFIY
jgi:hypothetical protein